MKKLLLIFNLFLPITILTTSTVSCGGKNKEHSFPYKNITVATIPSVESSAWFSSISKGNNIILINNNQQIVIPGNPGSGNNMPLSDINLDFSADWDVPDICAGTSSYMFENGSYYYILPTLCDHKIRIIDKTEPDSDGNCSVENTVATYIDPFQKMIKSKNKVFAWNDGGFWDDITDPYSLVEVTNSDITNQQCIWNSPDNILYLGTNKGLYTSSDNGTTWNFITGTESLNINSIIDDSSVLYLTTSNNGLWSYVTSSSKLTQATGTEGKKMNPNSLFISNDNKNLFFGIENEGLFELINLNIKNPYQILGSDIENNELITSTDNVKSIKETKNDVFVVMTNSNIFTFTLT